MKRKLERKKWRLNWIHLPILSLLLGACQDTNKVGDSIDNAVASSSFDPLIVYTALFVVTLIFLYSKVKREQAGMLVFGAIYLAVAGLMIWILDLPAMLKWGLGLTCGLVAYAMMKGRPNESV